MATRFEPDNRGLFMRIGQLGMEEQIAQLTEATATHPTVENYVALGYGDVVASGGWRLIGPIMALNGLLLIGWSVAVIFEVMRMAEVQVARKKGLR
jgi:hypothetical protein